MKTLILFILLLIVQPVLAQDIKLTLGIGTPININGFLGNDIYDSNGKLWNSEQHVIGSFIIAVPLSTIDFSFWHHSLLNDANDAGVSGLTISKTWTYRVY